MIEAKEIDQEIPQKAVEFSFCTLLTKPEEYQSLLQSLEEKGFNESNSQFIYIDNSKQNKADAYKGLNLMRSKCSAPIIIFIHQDIICYDNIDQLRIKIKELDQMDPKWAIAGNAGARELKNYFTRMTDRNLLEKKEGPFPALVYSLDENLLILKSEREIYFSDDLEGFHFYGTDICLQAAKKGYSAYVIDFHVQHYGFGVLTPDFFNRKKQFLKKYLKESPGQFIQTTCVRMYVGGGFFTSFLFNLKPVLFLVKEYQKWRNKQGSK